MKKLNDKLAVLLFVFVSGCSSLGPESDSGPDQVVAGAVPLAANASAKDKVCVSDGDKTDWYSLKGENTSIEITVLSDAKNLSTRIYRVAGRKQNKIFVRSLKMGKPARFTLKKDDLYVEVQATSPKGAAPYSIVRRDLTKGGAVAKIAKISVIDIYPLEGTRSLVLLNSSEEIKVGSTLAISGISSEGKSVDLGDCEVSSLSDGQASCTLPNQIKNKFGRYHAAQVN